MKKTLAAGYIVLLATGIYATRNIDSETGLSVHPVTKATQQAIQELHPAPQVTHRPKGDYTIDVYEDGSGVLYLGHKEVHTYGSDFFPWDCTDNGNEVCGATAPASVRGYKCKSFRFRDQDMSYCTDGTFTWGPHQNKG